MTPPSYCEKIVFGHVVKSRANEQFVTNCYTNCLSNLRQIVWVKLKILETVPNYFNFLNELQSQRKKNLYISK